MTETAEAPPEACWLPEGLEQKLEASAGNRASGHQPKAAYEPFADGRDFVFSG